MNYSKTIIEEKILLEIISIMGDTNYQCDYEKDEINSMISSLDFINLIMKLENVYNISFQKINFEGITINILANFIIEELKNNQKKHTEINETIKKIFEGES